MTIEEIIYFLFGLRSGFSGFFSRNLFWFEFLSVVVSVFLLAGIVYVVFRLRLIGAGLEKFADIVGAAGLSKRRAVRAWVQVERRFKLGDEANLKLAVIEADKILDEILKLAGYRGETMADRLKQLSPASLSNISGVWAAHKLRNRIVHEPDYRLNRTETEETLEIYKRAFREMGLID